MGRITPEMIALVPELAEWGDCEIGIEDWARGEAKFSMAIGFSRLFWPKFIEFEGYVLRAKAFAKITFAHGSSRPTTTELRLKQY